MLYCLFCRNKMLQKGNGTCPVERLSDFNRDVYMRKLDRDGRN